MVLSVENMTLLDLAKMRDPDGKVAAVVQALQQSNPIVEDMSWRVGNMDAGHKTTIQTGIPEPIFRKLYQFVPPSTSKTEQVIDTCGTLEAYSEQDAKLIEMSEQPEQVRFQLDMAHAEGFMQKVARYTFYGNETTENEAFTGLSPRFSSTTAENGSNIILADASPAGGDYTSIWLCGWGDLSGFGITPKGSKAGWQIVNKGKRTKDGSTGMMEVYTTHMSWDVGLCVRDWRYFVRIANIDISQLTKTGSTGSDLIDCLSQASELIQQNGPARYAIYANRKVKSFLRRQIANKVANSTLTMEMVGGKHVMVFDSIPVRTCDQLINTEALVA